MPTKRKPKPEPATPPTDFASRVVQWHRRHGRTHLPWQQQPTAYRVWVSEIMLQQTRVDTVIPYYQAFMTAFPALESLAQAHQDDVLRHWSGLGYYARARNLHRAAQQIVREHGGRFPREYDQVVALPGIGRSTAGAILSLAFGRRFPILDGNVKRVLARYFAVPGWPGHSAVSKKLWSLAETLTPANGAGRYNQAMMDLGATVCLRRNPGCAQCPLSGNCRAHLSGKQSDYPSPKPRRERPIREVQMLVIRNPHGELLLERRPPSGIWGGLLSFPEIPLETDGQLWWRELTGGQPRLLGTLPSRNHDFSHFRLVIHPRLFLLEKPGLQALDGNRWLWYKLGLVPAGGLAAPVQSLLREIEAQEIEA